jgi:hypothetical protein
MRPLDIAYSRRPPGANKPRTMRARSCGGAYSRKLCSPLDARFGMNLPVLNVESKVLLGMSVAVVAVQTAPRSDHATPLSPSEPTHTVTPWTSMLPHFCGISSHLGDFLSTARGLDRVYSMSCATRHRTPAGSNRMKSRIFQSLSPGGSARTAYFWGICLV